MDFTLPTVASIDAPDINAIVDNNLRKACALGVVPTPINDLMESCGIERVVGLKEVFEERLQTFPEVQQRHRRSQWKKIRGLASPKHRLVYTPALGHAGRDRFRDVHELFHVECPWHFIRDDSFHWEYDCTLSISARHIFEIEANYAGGRYLFQPDVFIPEANSLVVDFESNELMARRYGASIQATFRHFVEAQESPCVGISYLTNDYRRDMDGHSVLHKPVILRSRLFGELYPQWIPPLLAPDCWREAFVENEPRSGENNITPEATPIVFRWHALWTGYALLVLAEPVRVAPRQRVILPSTAFAHITVSR